MIDTAIFPPIFPATSAATVPNTCGLVASSTTPSAPSIPTASAAVPTASTGDGPLRHTPRLASSGSATTTSPGCSSPAASAPRTIAPPMFPAPNTAKRFCIMSEGTRPSRRPLRRVRSLHAGTLTCTEPARSVPPPTSQPPRAKDLPRIGPARPAHRSGRATGHLYRLNTRPAFPPAVSVSVRPSCDSVQPSTLSSIPRKSVSSRINSGGPAIRVAIAGPNFSLP